MLTLPMSWIRESKNAYKMDSITMKMSESRISEHPQHRPGRDRIAVATATGLCGCAHWLAEPILRVEFLCWPCARWCSVARGKRYSRMIASMKKISGREGRNEQPGKKARASAGGPGITANELSTVFHLSFAVHGVPLVVEHSVANSLQAQRPQAASFRAHPGHQVRIPTPRRLLELFSRLAS